MLLEKLKTKNCFRGKGFSKQHGGRFSYLATLVDGKPVGGRQAAFKTRRANCRVLHPRLV